jgi:hypothetical protein
VKDALRSSLDRVKALGAVRQIREEYLRNAAPALAARVRKT